MDRLRQCVREGKSAVVDDTFSRRFLRDRCKAAALEFDTVVKRLKTALGLCRALTLSDGAEDAIILSAQVEAMLDSVADIGSEQPRLEEQP